MKRTLIPILCLVALVAVVVYLLGPWRDRDAGTESGEQETDAPETNVKPGGSSGRERLEPPRTVKLKAEPTGDPIEIKSMIEMTDLLNDPDATMEEDLSLLENLMRTYRKYVKDAPQGGLNEEFVQCLRGANQRKMIFLREGHAKINENGELVDRFGTPYFFHPVSREVLEIRSAGPDKKFYTEDDLQIP